MTDTAGLLRSALRQILVDHMKKDPAAVTRLAASWDVPEASVRKMLQRDRWDLPLAIEAADLLGVDLHVTAG